jgi:hypothetical protein
MPHALVAGMTESGKTHLARAIARAGVLAGRGVLVLHRPREPWPMPSGRGPVWQSADPDAFLSKVRASRNCFVFVEMSDARFADGSQIEKTDTRFHALATDSRHEGHEVFFLCQRPVTLSPTIRENVSRLFLFRVGSLSANTLAEEWGDEALEKAPALPARHFFQKNGTFSPAILRAPIPAE